jgi:hypothetical protein
MAEYNFNVQDPYAAQAADIARRQKMAEIMQAQALQPIEKFSYNGIEARISPYQGLAKMLQAYMGGRGQAAALEEQKALGEKARSESQSQIKDFIGAITGTPGTDRPAVLDPQEIAQAQDRGAVNGDVSDTGEYQIPVTAAVAPDRQKALALALQSSNPMLQSAGGSLLTSILPKTPKWQASTKFNDKGEEIHGFVDINSPQPEDTFRASSTKPAALVSATTTDANGRPKQIYVNPRTVSAEGISQPLSGFYGELQQMGVDLNSPQVKSVLNSYVAGKSGNVTAKDAVDFQIKLASLGLASQRAAYEVPGGGAAMPNIPKPFNLFDMNRPSSAAAPQSNMPPAMPAQMPNQAPAQMPVQPPAARLANALRNAPVTTAPAVAPAVIPNAAPVRANMPNVASTAAPAAAPATSIPGGFDVSKLSLKDRNELLKHQIIDDGKPLTEFQGKATGYAARMLQANNILSLIGQNGKIQPGEIKRTLLGIPLVGGFLGRQANFTQSEAQQQIEQAQLNFVNALLRQESGASIQSPEFESATRQYFPQPNDKDPVLKQKAQNRAVAIKALEIEAGPGLQRMQKAQKLDNDALTWANANPNDPRSAAVKQKLGQ